MGGNGAGGASATASPTVDETLEDSPDSPFQCCVCLDLLYKPIVLACGHISCFWCVHKAMHGLQTSHCAICRQPYNHFPSICPLLHNLLQTIAPVPYKRRENEVLEEESRLDIFSPQFVDHLISERAHSEKINTGTLNGFEESSENMKARRIVASEKVSLPENGLDNGICMQVSVDDVLCAMCKELLFQPAVLNCGHVYCKSCLSGLAGKPLKCQICQNLHPGEFPNVCLDLDHFLEERFPREYAMRRETVQLEKVQDQHEDISSSSSQCEKQNAESSCHAKDSHSWFDENLAFAHVGVGCDSCGMYPIVGKRYRCKDCKEAIGFDLCGACYDTSSKLPGRFNQQHTPEHKFELDESKMLGNISRVNSLPLEFLRQAFFRAYLSDDPEDYLDNVI